MSKIGAVEHNIFQCMKEKKVLGVQGGGGGVQQDVGQL